MRTFIKIHPADTVAIALEALAANTALEADGQTIVLQEEIPRGHKFALTDLEAGQPVIKYGSPIGTAKNAIHKGCWVHTHNLATALGELQEYVYHPVKAERAAPWPEGVPAWFEGYRRADGSVGVRNEIWILPTVGCVNKVAGEIERQAQKFVGGTVEAIAAFPHPYGCSQMGEDQEHTRRILAALAEHPNAGGVLVLGLGCENTNIHELKKYMKDSGSERIRFLEAQEWEDEVGEAMKLVEELAVYAGAFHRERIPVSELVIGLKCGGSDGLSGITANPVVGRFSDLLIAGGGTAVLTEVPEMFGAETGLMNRCQSGELFDETVKMINGFKEYFLSHGQTIYENPSPGNKKGGISTLEDKSLGCVQKSGSTPVTGVLAYGEHVRAKGLNLLSAPGNDLVASTALAASGAHIVLFTTGRGTPFACPVPTMKISTNTPLAQKKKNWIDFDCGPVTEDGQIDRMGEALLAAVLETASGKQVKSEKRGFHDMAIWKQGVTL